MSVIGGPDIVEDGLIFYIDPGNTKSYSGSGTDATDLIYPTEWSIEGTGIYYDSSMKTFAYPDNATSKWIETDESFELTSDSSSLTYDFWCNLSNNTVSYPSLFYDRGQSTTPYVWIYTSSTEYLFIQYSTRSSYAATNTGFMFTNDNINIWLNIVIAVQYGDNPEIKTYINSDLESTLYPAGECLFPSENTTKRIGSYSNLSGHCWRGNIGTTKIYNRILDSTEILQNYDAIKGRYGL